MTDETRPVNADKIPGHADGVSGGSADGGRRPKKLLLFAGVCLVVLTGVAMGVSYTGLFVDSGGAGRQPAQTQPVAHFLDLDEMVVTLDTGGKSAFLKVRATLELEDAADEAPIRAAMPRIVDNLQVFLRELRIDELQGSQSLYRIREELVFRVNAVAHPAKVKDVLFKELVIQ